LKRSKYKVDKEEVVNSEIYPLRAIVGPARSGTTWIGALVDSCPEVIYRFEPFHRLAAVSPTVREWMRKLKNQEVRDADVPTIYSLLCPAHPLTNKAPFFPDKTYPLRTFGRRQLWPVARLIAPVRTIYRAAYSPQTGPPLVFKEVTFVRQLQNLVERTRVPVVYVVRHPCATVLSSLNAPGQGAIATKHLRLGEALRRNAPGLIERFPHIFEGSDVVSRHALFWLYEVETCVRVVRGSANGIVMTYEQLAEDAYAQANALFGHLGLEYGEPTKRFIDALYGLGAATGPGKPRRTGWGDNYYSVYRNPRDQKDAWKRKMPAADQMKVKSIVQGSNAIEYCASLGGWW
jgi:hypothetical protein